ncbi:hypothetical protein IU414_06545 [Nocardia farcinica]|uniref:hypothetical protein n=1 Tax=Nocardia farcinica TaxID=37329 RepID=UPI0018944723|nr:hypothetical protein [Nocardia farcinica]MBF6584418.1 hypothetical protein [Nocardia farcinica]
MPRSDRSKELEREIWEFLEQWLTEHGSHEPLIDTTFWTNADHRAYQTAFRHVKDTLEHKAGGDPEVGQRRYDEWLKGQR